MKEEEQNLIKAVMKRAGVDPLKFESAQELGWQSARTLRANYRGSTEEIDLKIYKYLYNRIKEEIENVGGKAHWNLAIPAIKKIFNDETMLMSDPQGNIILAIKEDHVDKLGLVPKVIIRRTKSTTTLKNAFMTLPGATEHFYVQIGAEVLKQLRLGLDYYSSHGDRPTANLTESGVAKLPEIVEAIRSSITQRNSLYQAVMKLPETTQSFYYTRRRAILDEMTEGDDYYWVPFRNTQLACLTDAGLEKLPGIVAAIRSCPQKISLHQAVLYLPGTTFHFYNARRSAILSQMEEDKDYYWVSYGSNQIAYLFDAGLEKLEAIVQAELKSYHPEGLCLREAMMAIKGTTPSFCNNRRDRILERLEKGEDYILSSYGNRHTAYLTEEGLKKLEGIVEDELKTYTRRGRER